MISINSIHQIPKDIIRDGLVITMGNFDGVHLGHQSLISDIKSKIHPKMALCVVVFNPHPRKILKPESTKFLINHYVERKTLLEQHGVDIILELEFTRDFSTQSPKEFLDNYIFTPGPQNKNPNNIKDIFLGYDFSFGANKEGDFEFAKNYCKNLNVNVSLQNEFKKNGETISSSLIRNFLLNGNCEKAKECLGRDFSLSGLVIKGEGRGRKIGFPTANLSLHRDILVPKTGVYVTQTSLDGLIYNSVTNVGVNPTFKENEIINVETHLLNFDRDIYGECMAVSFLTRLRDEQKFSSVNELVGQIAKDVDNTKKYFEKS